MTTAINIITPALETLGVQSRILPADASLIERAREVLVGVLEELAADDVELGTTDTPIVLPTTTATEVNNVSGTSQSLVDILAFHMVGPARVEMTATIQSNYKRSMRFLKKRYQNIEIANITPSKLLPRGQGSRGPLNQAFFNGESLENDASTTS